MGGKKYGKRNEEIVLLDVFKLVYAQVVNQLEILPLSWVDNCSIVSIEMFHL